MNNLITIREFAAMCGVSYQAIAKRIFAVSYILNHEKLLDLHTDNNNFCNGMDMHHFILQIR